MFQHLSKRNKILTALLCFAFAAAKLGGLWLWQQQQSENHAHQCQVTAEGCTFGQNARFRLHGITHHKDAFSMIAENLPEHTRSVQVSFSMQDMDMGFNRYNLKRQSDGSWRLDNARLPLCIAGRHDWLVEWTIDGKSHQAAFRTQP